MAGIYIHIPFCRRKCHYCNFYSVASLKYRPQFIEALTEEIYLRKDYLAGKVVQTVYFGGGTPSFLDGSDIQNILCELKKYYAIAADAEITLEANPDDLNRGLLEEYRNTGINRLSIGVQSFHDEDLKYLNRVHSASRSIDSIREALDAGFYNLSIDLIYGIPTLSSEKWEMNLEQAYRLGIPHISAYSLTVEPETALEIMIRKKLTTEPDEESSVAHFRILMERMREHGYEHYEISNFCKPGLYSRHNRQYWSGEPYLGLGPAAHSFNGHSREWNVGSIVAYADQIRRNDLFSEREELSKAQQYNEFVMVSLRTMWGCSVNTLQEMFGKPLAEDFSLRAMKYIAEGKMIEKESVYTLTDEGKLFADGIAADFFIEV